MFRVYLCNKRLVFDQSRYLLYFSYFINLCCYYPFRKYELKDLLIMSRRLSLNFHGMMKKLGYLTLQNCCYIPSLLSHFHGQCQTVGKKIKTPTILKHLSKKILVLWEEPRWPFSCQYSVAPWSDALGLVVQNILPTWFPYPSSCNISIFFHKNF